MDELCTSLNMVRNPDGSLTRPTIFPLLHPRSSCCSFQSSLQNSTNTVSVQSTDVPLNPSNNTWIRIFRPLLSTAAAITTGLPIIIYFHGGGFVFLSADAAPIHECCELMACGLPSIVVSVNYRLAPEHPLPAAYADAIDAVRWVQAQSQKPPGSNAWMMGADFSRCFLMGSSAGGNIAYHTALLLLALDLDLNRSSPPAPKIAGVIMDQPFFGGEQRTGSELRLAEDKILPLRATDVLWQLALPGGADRDHEFCNPMRMGVELEVLQQLPACMVRGTEGDPLVERQQEVVKMLGERGVDVVGRFEDEGCHGVHLFQPCKAEAFFMDLKEFIGSASS